MIEMLIIIILTVLAFTIAISVTLKRLGVSPVLYKSKQVYSDHAEKVVKPLFSHKHLLVGKPDSILHTGEGLVPVEIKSGNKPKQPYFSHIMQLISYCLLVELNREKPNRGFIQYKNGSPFAIEYTKELKNQLIELLDEMRAHIKAKKVPIIEDINWNKCNVCKYVENCAALKQTPSPNKKFL